MLVALGDHHAGPAGCVEVSEDLPGGAGRGLAPLTEVGNDQLTVGDLAGEGGPQSHTTRLGRHVVAVVPRLGPEDRATATPDGRLDVSRAGAARVLLLVGLLVGALDFAAPLGGGRALALVCHVHDHRVLQGAVEDLLAERRDVQLDFADAAGLVAFDLHRWLTWSRPCGRSGPGRSCRCDPAPTP